MGINYADLPEDVRKLLGKQVKQGARRRICHAKDASEAPTTQFSGKFDQELGHWKWRECKAHGWGWLAAPEVDCVFCDEELDYAIFQQ